jgi:hypothetical protein
MKYLKVDPPLRSEPETQGHKGNKSEVKDKIMSYLRRTLEHYVTFPGFRD